MLLNTNGWRTGLLDWGRFASGRLLLASRPWSLNLRHDRHGWRKCMREAGCRSRPCLPSFYIKRSQASEPVLHPLFNRISPRVVQKQNLKIRKSISNSSDPWSECLCRFAHKMTILPLYASNHVWPFYTSMNFH